MENKKSKTKIIGYNYLHSHPATEKLTRDKGYIDENHIIVDRKDWEEVCQFFHDNPKHIEDLGKSKYTLD